MSRNLSTMTLADAIGILTDYSLIHTTDMGLYDGLCMHNPRIILIDSDASTRRKPDTIIHELYHAMHFLRGEGNSEERVQSETRRTMRKLYGKR